MGEYYILEGHEVKVVDDVLAWGKWFGNNNRHVADDKINGVRVSTVFLGIDHAFSDSKAPLLFETMVFGGKLDQEMSRYSTWDEADAGHKAMLKRVKEAC